MNQDKKMGQHSGRKSDSTGVVKRLGATLYGEQCFCLFFLTTGLVSVVSCLLILERVTCISFLLMDFCSYYYARTPFWKASSNPLVARSHSLFPGALLGAARHGSLLIIL